MDAATYRRRAPTPAEQTAGLGLFEQAPPTHRMARASDPATSHAAAAAVAPHLSALQARVLAAIRRFGPIDAATLESLPEFADLGFSTCRKRVSELAQRGLIRAYDVQNRITRWVAVEGADG